MPDYALFRSAQERQQVAAMQTAGEKLVAVAKNIQKNEQPKAEEPPKPGSLLEQIQNDVDKVETVPVPTQEPLDTNPR